MKDLDLGPGGVSLVRTMGDAHALNVALLERIAKRLARKCRDMTDAETLAHLTAQYPPRDDMFRAVLRHKKALNRVPRRSQRPIAAPSRSAAPARPR